MTAQFEYLASPYSHEDDSVQEERYLRAMHAMTWLLRNDIYVFAPIVQCRPAALRYGLPHGAAWWLKFDTAMVLSSKGVIVLAIDGWTESHGVMGEIRLAIKHNLPVRKLVPTEGALHAEDDYFFDALLCDPTQAQWGLPPRGQ